MKKLCLFFLSLLNTQYIFLMEIKHQNSSLCFNGEVQSACFNKDGTELLILTKGEKNFIVSTFKDEKIVEEVEIRRSYFNATASYNASEKKIIIEHLYHNQVSVFDRDTDEITEYLLPKGSEFVCFNKTETEMLMRLPRKESIPLNRGNLVMRDIETNKILFSATYADFFIAACLNEDETQVATMTNCGRLHIWDKKTGKELLTKYYGFSGITGRSVSFCPQTQELLIYGASPVILLQDRNNINVTKAFRHPEVVTCARRNGDKICTMACDGSIRIWDINKQEVIKTIPINSLFVNSLEWSTDGTKIVVGFGKKVEIWSCQD